MSDGSRHSLALVEEASYGVTPANPVWLNVRHNSCNLSLTKDTKESAEIRPDRMIADLRHGVRKVAGDIPVDFAYGAFDPLIEAALCGLWSVGTPIAGTDQLKAGVNRKSFSMERLFGDIAPADKPYHRFTGVEVNGFSLSIKSNAIVNATFSLVGKDMALDTAAVAGATYQDVYPSYTEAYDTFTGTILEGGAAIAIVTEVALKLENGIAPRYVVGSNTTAAQSIGKSKLSGTVTAYFESATMLEKFLNETTSSLELTLVDAAAHTLKITVPKIKYTGGQPDVGGDGPITLAMPFTALYDSTTATNFVLERTA